MADYLIHHGIKGQKWGLRRFQNEDMSLTAAGRKRYGVGNPKESLTSTKPSWKAAGTISENPNNFKKPVGVRNASKQELTPEEKDARNKKIKTAVGIGLAAAGVGLAAYGAYKVSEVQKNKSALLAKSREFLNKIELNKIELNKIPINVTEVNRTPISNTTSKTSSSSTPSSRSTLTTNPKSSFTDSDMQKLLKNYNLLSSAAKDGSNKSNINDLDDLNKALLDKNRKLIFG